MICLISLLYWSLFEGFLGWFEAFLGEKLRFLVFKFAESLELIKGGKQFHTE